jgi:hypothetical protein
MTFNANDYQAEIDKINGKIEEFQRTEEKVDESFLEVGNILVSIKNEKNLDDKIFRQLKKEVAKTISIRNINKVVAIAQCDVIQRNKERLPKSWSSLYLLSRMENLEELIESKKKNNTHDYAKGNNRITKRATVQKTDIRCTYFQKSHH